MYVEGINSVCYYVMVVVAVSTHLTGVGGVILLTCADNMVECR